MQTPSPSKKLSTFDFPWSANLPSDQEDGDQSICPEDINPPILADRKRGVCVAENTWMVFSKDLDVQGIALKLLQDSWCILKQLRLENWVEQVLENSSTTITIFQTYYENLCFSLFDFLRRFPLEAKKYRSALEVSCNEPVSFQVMTKGNQTIRPNDFFLHQTLMHAFKLFDTGVQYEKLNLDANLIIRPLQTLFSQADKNVLCKLKVLEVRYKRYQMASYMAQGQDFDVGTIFLDSILEDTAKSVANQLSQNVLRQFRCLSLESVLTHDQNIQLLGTQWSDLCHNAEEIASAGVLQEKVMAVAQVYN